MIAGIPYSFSNEGSVFRGGCKQSNCLAYLKLTVESIKKNVTEEIVIFYYHDEDIEESVEGVRWNKLPDAANPSRITMETSNCLSALAIDEGHDLIYYTESDQVVYVKDDLEYYRQLFQEDERLCICPHRYEQFPNTGNDEVDIRSLQRRLDLYETPIESVVDFCGRMRIRDSKYIVANTFRNQERVIYKPGLYVCEDRHQAYAGAYMTSTKLSSKVFHCISTFSDMESGSGFGIFNSEHSIVVKPMEFDVFFVDHLSGLDTNIDHGLESEEDRQMLLKELRERL